MDEKGSTVMRPARRSREAFRNVTLLFAYLKHHFFKHLRRAVYLMFNTVATE